MKRIKLLHVLYLIPLLGLIIAMVWTLINHEHLRKTLSPAYIFFGGLSHLVTSMAILSIVITRIS